MPGAFATSLVSFLSTKVVNRLSSGSAQQLPSGQVHVRCLHHSIEGKGCLTEARLPRKLM